MSTVFPSQEGAVWDLPAPLVRWVPPARSAPLVPQVLTELMGQTVPLVHLEPPAAKDPLALLGLRVLQAPLDLRGLLANLGRLVLRVLLV